MRRAVGILLFKKNKTFLLQLRDDNVLRWPGYWGFFGGGVNRGEGVEVAMVRETIEELGIIPKSYQLAMTQEYSDNYDHSGIKYIYIAPFEEQIGVKLLEGRGMDWFSFDQIDDLKVSDHDRQALDSIHQQCFK